MYKCMMLWSVLTMAGMAGPAWSFGSPMVVVTDSSRSEIRSSTGEQELTFALDGLAPTQVTWDVTVAVSTGWSAVTAAPSIISSSVADGRPSLVDVQVAPIHAKCPPKGLVVHLTFTDPMRDHDD